MNKLTTISTITKAAPLALLAVVMSGNAFAGPKGERPNGPKFSIDVVNECTVSGSYLNIKTSVTPSGSQPGDGGGELGIPSAQAAFQGEVCKTLRNGKLSCSTGFLPAGYPEPAAPEPMDFNFGSGNWEASINLCATKAGETISKGTAVNSFVYVPVIVANPDCAYPPVSGDEFCVDGNGEQIDAFIVQATWESNCDDIDQPGDYAEVDGEWVDVVDQSDVNVPEDIDCTPLAP
jgi:hypothetical protein